MIDAALEAAQCEDKLALTSADPDAEVVYTDESETIEIASSDADSAREGG